MRRLSIALTVSMLLAPATSLAYQTPSELFTALQAENAAQTFSLTAHAHTNGTYVSVWLNGSGEGSDPMSMQMSAKATVDVVHGALKIRTKAEVMIVGDMLYARMTSMDGTYQNAFASISGMLKQKQWIRMPVEEAMISEMTGGTPLSVGYDYDPAQTDGMFVMQTSAGKNGTTVHSLSLSPDYAPQLAMMIREILNDQSPASDDFFPWRQLAEGLRYEGQVITNASGKLVSSWFELSTSSTTSSLSVSGKASPAGKITLSAPANSITVDEAMMMFGDLNDDMAMEEEYEYESDMMPVETEDDMLFLEDGTTFDFVDDATSSFPSADCSDPDMTPGKLLDLQRSGVCPVQKATTRHGGW